MILFLIKHIIEERELIKMLFWFKIMLLQNIY